MVSSDGAESSQSFEMTENKARTVAVELSGEEVNLDMGGHTFTLGQIETLRGDHCCGAPFSHLYMIEVTEDRTGESWTIGPKGTRDFLRLYSAAPFSSLAQYAVRFDDNSRWRAAFNLLLQQPELATHPEALKFLEIRPIDPSTGLSASFSVHRGGGKSSLKEGYMYKQLAGVEGTVQFILRRSLALLLMLLLAVVVAGATIGVVHLVDQLVLVNNESLVDEVEQTAPIAAILVGISSLVFCYLFVCRCSDAKLPLAEERKRWFVLMPDYIAYYRRHEDTEPAGVLLFEA